MSAIRSLTLVVRRTIRATPERLFEAWTRPDQLQKWWGPKSVTCIAAEVDLKVGGRYRIANQFPDGNILWIAGEFEIIERPRKLAYTWALEPQNKRPPDQGDRPESDAGPSERVVVTFEARGPDTEVIVTHERILNPAMRDRHEQGWFGCLEGLEEYLRSR